MFVCWFETAKCVSGCETAKCESACLSWNLTFYKTLRRGERNIDLHVSLAAHSSSTVWNSQLLLTRQMWFCTILIIVCNKTQKAKRKGAGKQLKLLPHLLYEDKNTDFEGRSPLAEQTTATCCIITQINEHHQTHRNLKIGKDSRKLLSNHYKSIVDLCHQQSSSLFWFPCSDSSMLSGLALKWSLLHKLNHQDTSSWKQIEEDTRAEESLKLRRKDNIPVQDQGWRVRQTRFWVIQSNLPEICSSKFPFLTRPAGSALLLLLKERRVKRPAGEEQEGEGTLESALTTSKLLKIQDVVEERNHSNLIKHSSLKDHKN